MQACRGGGSNTPPKLGGGGGWSSQPTPPANPHSQGFGMSMVVKEAYNSLMGGNVERPRTGSNLLVFRAG